MGRKHFEKRRNCLLRATSLLDNKIFYLPTFKASGDKTLEVFQMMLKPITRQQILNSSEMKEFADDNFKFDENGRKLSKQVENTVGKGEGACYEQFLLFPQCFQKACFPRASKGVIVWEWVKLFCNGTKHIRNGQNASHQCFLLLGQCFYEAFFFRLDNKAGVVISHRHLSNTNAL